MYLLGCRISNLYKLHTDTFRLLELTNQYVKAIAELQLSMNETFKEVAAERRTIEDGTGAQTQSQATAKKPTNSRAKKATTGVNRPDSRAPESSPRITSGREEDSAGGVSEEEDDGGDVDDSFGGRQRYPTPTIVSIPLGSEALDQIIGLSE